MAKPLETTIKVTGAKEYRDSINSIKQSIVLLNAEQKKNDAQAGISAKSTENLTKQNTLLGKKLEEQSNIIKTTATRYETLSKQEGVSEKTLKSLAIQLEQAKTYYAQTNNQIEANTKQMEENNNVTEKGTKNYNLLGVALGGLAIAFGTVVAGLTASTKIGAEFESQMATVGATMGLTAEQVENGDASLKAMSESARELGANTSLSATQGAEALTFLAQKGLDASQSIEILGDVANLALAGNLDLGTATNYLTGTIKAMGLELDQSSEIVDQWAKANANSGTTVSELGEGMLVVGANAKELNGGVLELTTGLSILADAEIKGADGGTKFRNIIQSG